jgi:hypothetical protein
MNGVSIQQRWHSYNSNTSNRDQESKKESSLPY